MENEAGATTAPRKRRRELWIIPIAAVNFTVFVVVAISLGGDACNGMSLNGHYFLDSHGRLTEVSGATYVYSLCHATSVVFTHVAALFAGYRWVASSPRHVT